MPVHHYKKSKWPMLSMLLLLSGLTVACTIWCQRHQLDGLRNEVDSVRHALRGTTGCSGDFRRILLQSLKRAMPVLRCMLMLDR
jgi:hypothetical protein